MNRYALELARELEFERALCRGVCSNRGGAPACLNGLSADCTLRPIARLPFGGDSEGYAAVVERVEFVQQEPPCTIYAICAVCVIW